MSLHDRIKEARRKKGLTQTDLGNLIGVAKTTVAGYEKNREPTAAQIGQIADALDVDVTFLLQDEIQLRRENTASPAEMDFIKKYRDLDDYGRETVNYIVDRELIRVAQLKEKSSAPDDAEDEYQMVARGGKVVKPNKPFDADAFKAALDGVEQTDNL